MPKTILEPVTALKLALLASIATLAMVFIAQYGFGLKPCHLCTYQRIPYALVIWFALIGLMVRKRYFWLLGLIGLIFLGGAGIAAYHTAVENKLVAGPTGCTAQAGAANESIDDFMKRIQDAPIVSCDQPQWDFHGITMAGLNAVWSLALAGFAFAAARQAGGRGNAHA